MGPESQGKVAMYLAGWAVGKYCVTLGLSCVIPVLCEVWRSVAAHVKV